MLNFEYERGCFQVISQCIQQKQIVNDDLGSLKMNFSFEHKRLSWHYHI